MILGLDRTNLTFDARHYSYECKATTQDRPYSSRPSRTQQLLNPSLKPRLTNDKPNELLRKEGVADQVLAQAQAQRDAIADSIEQSHKQHENILPIRTSKSRTRSLSRSSSKSVSTISTRKSRSMSPPQNAMDSRHSTSYSHQSHRQRDNDGRHLSSNSASYRPPKRKHSQRSDSHSRSLSASRSRSRSRSRSQSQRRRDQQPYAKSRRYGSSSPPRHRGRPTSERRGSHRDRSADQSVINRNHAALKGRRSLEIDSDISSDSGGGDNQHDRRHRGDPDRQRREEAGLRDRGHGNRDGDKHRFEKGDSRDPRRSPPQQRQQQRRPPPPSRNRSLSPFSKRLALTQAMNMAR